ncbi:hypothetical protein LUZ60_016065 [Juncus effusus]|nr:hypothetical protein LUZ60_016065 [Juncus effusus]
MEPNASTNAFSWEDNFSSDYYMEEDLDTDVQFSDPNEVIHNEDEVYGNESMDKSEPYIGMEFESDEQAYEFYNLYGYRKGFSIRRYTNFFSKKLQKITSVRYTCSKQGFKPGDCVKPSDEDAMEPSEDAISDVQKTPQKLLPHKRSGCEAFIHVKLNKVGKWAIKTLNNEHNHALIKKDPEFFYTVETDDDHAVKNIFWVDGQSRRYYERFGDVISFDTTYATNKYCMPFAPFLGVNHHRQTIFFGCALVRDEGKLSFEWLFTAWMKAMNGKHPTAIITDQDPAMRAAIEKIFPNTVHRSCQWHVMRKAREHLGKMLESIYAREAEQDFRTLNEEAVLWSPYPIEKDARRVYTRNMFSLFKNRLKLACEYGVTPIVHYALYEVAKVENTVARNIFSTSYRVKVDLTNSTVACKCKGFEFGGILCAHALKVMQIVGLHHLPDKYVLNRWKKNANEGVNISIYQTSTNTEGSMDSEVDRYNALHVQCLKLLAKGSKDLDAYHLASEVFEELDRKLTVHIEVDASEEEIRMVPNEEDGPVRHEEYHDPPVSQCKGKRKPQRLKPPADIAKDKKRRICSGCGKKDGHNTRTCPMVLRDNAHTHHISFSRVPVLYYNS